MSTFFGILFAVDTPAAPRAELWVFWSQSVESVSMSIDHLSWQHFLSAHVTTDDTGMNRVSYGGVSDKDRVGLDEYIQRLSGIQITGYPRNEQLAYWINLYNALTVRVILEHYPVQSIKRIDISPGWFSSGPWGKKLISIEGRTLSLDDIEHRILRPIWKDPRIHYAVNCASVGCPDLSREAYNAANIDEQLTAAARRYVNHPRGVSVENNQVRISSIYRWFEDDFGGSEAAVLDHLRGYASVDLLEKLNNVSGIFGYQYDWALNDSFR
jgi:hypothetical protein